MANKCELGESYKDTVFLGTGKFYLRVGQSSYKELNLLSENSNIFKVIESEDEISDDGIYIIPDSSEIFFVVNGTPVELNFVKTTNQELTKEQQEQIFKNLGLISEGPPKELSFLYLDSKSNTYYVNTEKGVKKLADYLISLLLGGNVGSSDNSNLLTDSIRSTIYQIISESDINFRNEKFLFKLKNNDIFDITDKGITLFKQINHYKGFSLTGTKLTIDTVEAKEIIVGKKDNYITIDSNYVNETIDSITESNKEEIVKNLLYNYEKAECYSLLMGDSKINFYKKNKEFDFKNPSITDSKIIFAYFVLEKQLPNEINLLSLDELKKELKNSLIPKCVYLKDIYNNEGNFNFYNELSTDTKWAFGGTENKVSEVKNTKIEKGQVIEFDNHINNIQILCPYIKCKEAENSVINVTEDSVLGNIYNSKLIGSFKNEVSVKNCELVCETFNGTSTNYEYKQVYKKEIEETDLN